MRGSLEQLVKELQRQLDSKVDFIADSRTMYVAAIHPEEGGNPTINLAASTPQTAEWIPDGVIPVNDYALKQLGERMDPGVPPKFIMELAGKRPEITQNFLTQLMEESAKPLMVRCLDGNVRAFLSDRYRVMDHWDLAMTALDTAKEVNAFPLEASLTDNRMHLKLTTKEVWDWVDEGRKGGRGAHEFLRQTGGDILFEDADPNKPKMHPVVTITNSETGSGGLNVKVGLLRDVCVNLAIAETCVTQVHLGQKQVAGMFSRETLQMDSQVIMAKARDSIKAAFHPAKFGKLMEQLRASQERAIVHATGAVQNLVKDSSLTQDAQEGILAYFLRDYDQNAYGLSQAVARAAQDVDDADTASDLEDLAGGIITGNVKIKDAALV